MRILKTVIILISIYLTIGILVTFFVPIHPNTCGPCPKGALCGICSPFDENRYYLTDMITLKFWKSAIYWPFSLVGFAELQSDLSSGRRVRIDPREIDKY